MPAAGVGKPAAVPTHSSPGFGLKREDRWTVWISHVKNGIYGEMFVAAMLAASFVTSDVKEVIEIGLSEIRKKCRLSEAVHDTVAWYEELSDWKKVWDRIFEKYGHIRASTR